MKKQRRMILVTGAPRTATTPVGNLLARCPRAVSLYEPIGPTGLARVQTSYPIVGSGLGIQPEDLPTLLNDLRELNFDELKCQQREKTQSTLKLRIFGSRTLHSIRLARLQPWATTVIWKDPHAVFMVPDLVGADLDIVVTVRTPWAHAASYKRRGWRSKAREVYPRWSIRYGRCGICEAFLGEASDSVVSAALLWRMSYLCLLRTEAAAQVSIITSEDLEKDERSVYLKLLSDLKLASSPAIDRLLSVQRRNHSDSGPKQKVHDWKRSLASLNNYWTEVLTTQDLERVHSITADIVPHFFSGGVLSSPSSFD